MVKLRNRLRFLSRWYFDKTLLFFQRLYWKSRGREIVHYLHIGKTGGTALKHALEEHLVTPRYFIKLHRHHYFLKHVPVGEKFFFSIRDPKDKFTSAFYSRQREDRPKFYLPWNHGEAVAFTTFDTPNELALALSSDDKELREKAELSMRTMVHVRESYWRWFADETYLESRLDDLLHICHLKSMDEDFATLKSILEMPEGVSLPKDGKLSHSSSKNLDRSLDARALSNLRNWYSEDYELMSLLEEKKLIPKFD